MNLKTSLTLAGAVAVALGAAPLALAQQPTNMAPPTMATAPSTAPSTMPSPTMTTSSRTASMASPMMTSSHAGTMHNKTNMSKSEIMRIQRALRGMGYYLTVDGAWGQGTADDIKDLQFKNGLKVTGKPDANTMRALGLKGDQDPAGANMNTQSSSGSMRSNRSQSMPSPSMTTGSSPNMSTSGMHQKLSQRRMEAKQQAMEARQQSMKAKQQAMEAKRQSMETKQQAMEAKQKSMTNNMQGMHANLSQRQIKNVQIRLSRQGYQVNQNGKWDTQTHSAIIRFQKKNGIKTTGYPGPKTRRALNITSTMWQSWAGPKTMSPTMGTS